MIQSSLQQKQLLAALNIDIDKELKSFPALIKCH